MIRAAFSYRDDPCVPAFDDSRPLFVFDGVCVLCSGGAAFVMRHDPNGRIAFTSAQETLGMALFRHYGMDMDETYLLLSHGRAYGKSTGYLVLTTELGGFWRIANLVRIVPRALRDWLYDLVARNRYRWFGKTGENCALLTPEQRQQLL